MLVDFNTCTDMITNADTVQLESQQRVMSPQHLLAAPWLTTSIQKVTLQLIRVHTDTTTVA